MAKKLRNPKSGSASSSSKKSPKGSPLLRRDVFSRKKKQSPNLFHPKLSRRSEESRARARRVLSATRRNPKLSLNRAARLERVKPSTVLKYFASDFRKSSGQFRVTKGDRHTETVYLPNSQGQVVARETHSSKERSQASEFLRELGRYRRNKPNKLSKWANKTIGGIRPRNRSRGDQG